MKVLVVIDAQNDFIDGALGSKEAQAAVPHIAERIAKKDFDLLVFTQDTHSENYMQTREGAKLPVPHCLRGSDGWKVSPVLLEAAEGIKDVRFIAKPTFGSFDLCNLLVSLVADNRRTAPAGYIRGGAPNNAAAGLPNSTSPKVEVEFCGFCTDICVVSNVLICKAALYEDADIRVNAACCAGVTPAKHQAALETMASCQIEII